MNPLHTIAEIRTIEQAAMAELPSGALMQRAGQAAAALALEMLPQKEATVLVLAGSGNNGGDALEVAAHLANFGASVSVLLYAQSDKQPADAQQALQRASLSAVRMHDIALPEAGATLARSTQWSLIIDGLFGIGIKKPLTGELQKLIATVNSLSCPVLSLDVPSGLDADTGSIAGDQGIAICASHTITFIADKPGLHTLKGRDHAGQVTVASLDISPHHYPAPHLWLNGVALFSSSLRPRRHDSHKGSHGNVAVVGGSSGMAGAPVLAARAALHSGAGRVYVVFPDNPPAYDHLQPELMFRHAQQFDLSTATLVAGPGLGQSRVAHELLAQVLNSPNPVVLDADALNLIATEPGLQQKAINRRQPTLLTPHPLEAARLLDMQTDDVQADRVRAALLLAKKFRAHVILKGSGSIIAMPDGKAFINPTGNPALATAGTGDVLAGMCGALLAQGWPVHHAALGATWLHGAAADDLVAQGIGPIGLAACELFPAVRARLNQIAAQHAWPPP